MIGVFDSGLGGLTVAKELKRKLGDYDLIYLGDTARTPYGNKGKEVIVRYALEDADFLVSKGAKIIVAACNTVSALAMDSLKRHFPKIVFFEVVLPAVKKASAVTKNGRVGVIGTRATIGSNIYENKIKQRKSGIKVFPRACPLLVPLVEEGWLTKKETKMILRGYLQDLKTKNIDTLILACTHYPMLKALISARMGKQVELVDSAKEVVADIKRFLEESPAMEKQLPRHSSAFFYFSDAGENVRRVAEKWMGRSMEIKKAILGR